MPDRDQASVASPGSRGGLVLLAFQGGVGQGLAVLFIPLYALIYALSKSRSKIASSMYIIGLILNTVGIIVYDFK